MGYHADAFNFMNKFKVNDRLLERSFAVLEALGAPANDSQRDDFAFDAACQVLRESWSTNSSDWDPSWTESWTASSYFYAGDLFTLLTLIGFLAVLVWVFLHGDQGFTSGYAGFELGRLYTCLACGVCTLGKRVYSALTRKQESVHVKAAAEQFNTVPLAQSATQVTLARTHVICAQSVEYVCLPIARLGDVSKPTTAGVALVNRTAKMGTEFGEVVEDETQGCIRDPGTPGGAIITFPAKARMVHIYIPIKHKVSHPAGDSGAAEFSVILRGAQTSGKQPTATGPLRACTVRIVDNELYPNGMELAIGKQRREAREQYDLREDKEKRLSHLLIALAKEPSAGAESSAGDVFIGLEPVADAGAAKQSAEHGVDEYLVAEPMSTSSAPSPPPSPPPPGGITKVRSAGLRKGMIAANLADAVQDISSRSISMRFITDGSISREHITLIWNFFARASRINGMYTKIASHQLAYFIIAYMDNFIEPLLYRLLMIHGLGERDFKWAWTIGFTFMIWRLLKYHIKLNYFHGSMLVMQHLRASLLRKYLSLDAIDHAKDPKLRHEFETAVTYDVEALRNSCWKGVFHNGLPNLYKVLASLTYLFVFGVSYESQWSIIVVAGYGLILVLVPFLWYFSSIGRGWEVWRTTNILENSMQGQLNFIMKEWRIIRRASSTLEEMNRTFNTFWDLIRRGYYVDWYYRFYLREPYKLFLGFMTASLWIFSADQSLAFTASEFAPLLNVVRSLGSGAQSVMESVLTVAISGSNVDYIAWLLNLETNEMRESKRLSHAASASKMETHRDFSCAFDSVLQEFEAINTRDTRSVAQLLSMTQTLGEDKKLDADALTDAKNLANWWALQILSLSTSASAIGDADEVDPQIGRVAGSLLIGDMTFQHPITGQYLFEKFNVLDERTPQQRAAQVIARAVGSWLARRLKSRNTGSAVRSAMVDDLFELPPNKLIGLRTKYSKEFQLTEISLFQMFNGGFKPRNGTARCTRRAALIDAAPDLFIGTLMDNILYSLRHQPPREDDGDDTNDYIELDKDGNPTPATSKYLWDLCKRIGVAELLIGRKYDPNWGDFKINIELQNLCVVDLEDANKIQIVRALVAMPDVILIHRATDSWPIRSVQRLCTVLHEYIAQGHGRNVVMCAKSLTLSVCLSEDDLVLSLESRRRATLRVKRDSGIHADVEHTIARWTKSMRNGKVFDGEAFV